MDRLSVIPDEPSKPTRIGTADAVKICLASTTFFWQGERGQNRLRDAAETPNFCEAADRFRRRAWIPYARAVKRQVIKMFLFDVETRCSNQRANG